MKRNMFLLLALTMLAISVLANIQQYGRATDLETKLIIERATVHMYESRHLAVPGAYYKIEAYAGESPDNIKESSFFLVHGVVFDGPENKLRDNGASQVIEVPRTERRSDGYITVVKVDGDYKPIFLDDEAKLTRFQLNKY